MKKKIILSSILALGVLGGVVGLGNHIKPVEAAVSDRTIYLKLSSEWASATASYRGWVWGGNTQADYWVNFTDTDEDGILEGSVKSDNTDIIFLRAQSGSSDWNNEWNRVQTTLPSDKNQFNVSGWDSGSWGTYTAPKEIYEELGELVSSYYNGGTYTRETKINLSDAAALEAKEYFHDTNTLLERTTYFDGDALWMTNEEGTYSYYGTSGNDMTGGRVSSLNETSTKVAKANVGGMEGYYTTLKDISESINQSQNWTKASAGVYKSSDPSLIQKFMDFTAPCFKNLTKDANSENYIIFDYVTVEFSVRSMVLKLHVNSTDAEKTNTGSSIFSSAIITKPVTSTTVTWVIPGSMNGWNSAVSAVSAADGVSYKVYELAAGDYEFKLTKGSDWYGNGGTIEDSTTATSAEGWKFSTGEGTNCKFAATGGTYLFEAYDATIYVIKLA